MAFSLSSSSRPIPYPPSLSNTSAAANSPPPFTSLSLRFPNSNHLPRRLSPIPPTLRSSSPNLGRRGRNVRPSLSIDDSSAVDLLEF
uniref:Uncharacterized protein n=1 Tax=Kalanchoe fedtschenkoi TaxID=63787 RepID=A0A7N0V9H4_KALFE